MSVEVPISTIAVEADASKGRHEEGDFTAFDAGSAIAYQMCGFGSTQQDCGIVSDVGSTSRGRLLRREALELALYTLKYVPGTNAYTYDYQTLPGDGTAILVLTAAIAAQ